MGIRCHPGLTGAEYLELGSDRLGQELANVPLDQLRNFCGVLIRDQTRREFRACLRWDHRFCALARISTPDAVQLKRGPRPELLNDRVTPLAAQCRSAHRFAEFLLFPGE